MTDGSQMGVGLGTDLKSSVVFQLKLVLQVPILLQLGVKLHLKANLAIFQRLRDLVALISLIPTEKLLLGTTSVKTL